jgi:hypothetical protein
MSSSLILTGAGDALMSEIDTDGFDFFTPIGYDKIYREGKKILMNLLDIEVPMIAAVNGPVLTVTATGKHSHSILTVEHLGIFPLMHESQIRKACASTRTAPCSTSIAGLIVRSRSTATAMWFTIPVLFRT